MTTLVGMHMLVTGASGGLGSELVKCALRHGAAEVYAAVRLDDEHHRRLLKKVVDSGRVSVIELDVTRDASVASALQKCDRVDVLINCAAVCRYASVLSGNLVDFEDEIQVNVLGSVRVCRAVLETFESLSVIVNVSSRLGWHPNAELGTYSATKAALISVTRSMAQELRSKGVRCVAACPGALDTAMSRSKTVSKMNPAAAAEEIMNAIHGTLREVPIGDSARTLSALTSLDLDALDAHVLGDDQ